METGAVHEREPHARLDLGEVGAIDRIDATRQSSHHVWATLRLVDASLALSQEQLETAVPGTDGSILDTAQALHHGTDHRSQICTALTTLGVEPLLIDVWDLR